MPDMFTAAQAAQKLQARLLSSQQTFTAAQAAQKRSFADHMALGEFTAAQAAQKTVPLAYQYELLVHCRTGSSETVA